MEPPVSVDFPPESFSPLSAGACDLTDRVGPQHEGDATVHRALDFDPPSMDSVGSLAIPGPSFEPRTWFGARHAESPQLGWVMPQGRARRI